ncbi:pectin esterase [Hymenobacter taeanensis]|uniref:Pectinesterase n=1 Tax=Hymenobacter taeanensis TaxID=2735321 RepID=A0A6M6BJC9_9BACT|nr:MULTISPECIES: pectinesterase family protein [Hymenobacter]QJX47998.1 pectin esterase [Hymenobacter taeanensis]UOQ82554.1 pectinesterase family protein [Hymenobacter sp. 5414T-23]
MKKLIAFLCLSWLLMSRAVAYDFVVAQDGSGNYRTVQEAFNAVPDFRKKVTTIFIKNGTYKEKLILAGSKNLVKLIGEDLKNTILTYDDYNQKKNIFGEDKGTSGSSSIYIYGSDFSVENITFQNSSGPVGQAVAVWVAGDKARFKNCRFLGFQDTLYTYGYGSRQYYQDCYIEGTVDFIFGSSTAWFEGCTIFCKKGGGYVTAASTPDSTRYGYIFRNCKITGDAPAGSFVLGRPWRPYAKTVFMQCELGEQIRSEGWDHWEKESNKQTASYAEYKNRGKGFQPTRRVPWSRQLTDQQAQEYTLEKVFRNWNPTQE